MRIMTGAKKENNFGTAFGVIFALIFVVALHMTILQSNGIWEFGGTLLFPQYFEGTSHGHRQNNSHTNGHTNFPSEISPNLTSCHESYGRPGFVVNCCPPSDDKSRPAPVDFHFPDPSKSPLRIRRPIHRLDSEYLAKYAKAISIMKALPHSDPRSFSRQADIHCIFCTGAYNINYSSRGLNVHREWLFFPFHRMYLYFHERILGSLIDDDTFSLPFWPWDHPDAMYFPEMFLNEPFSDTERDRSHFSPRLVDLAFNSRAAEEDISVTSIDNLSLMYNQMVSGASKPELFMGCSMHPGEDGFCNGPGTVELAPHNTVHSWVGSASNPGREDMGVFYSAARDPSFYPHHANVDRLWDVWRDLHGFHVPIKDPVWLNSYFYFYDETSQLVKIKVSDVLNITQLRYSYESVELVWLNHRPKPSVDPLIAKRELRKRVMSSQIHHSGQNLGSPIKVKVQRPDKRNGTKKEKEEEEEVLVVYGIGVEANVDTLIKFDVYVNLVNETKLGPGYREFVGTFTRLPEGGKKDKTKSNSGTLKLGISEALKDLEADEDDSIWVTLLPSSNSCSSVTIGGIRIEYMR